MSVFKQILTVLVLLVAAAGLWVALVPSAMPFLDRIGALGLVGMEAAPRDDTAQEDAAYASGPTRVAIAPVTESALNDRATALGDGRAIRSVTVTPEVSGRLTELGVTSGARVAEGDLLAQIDAEAERIALARAEAMRADARDTLDRLRRLQDSGAVPDVELQTAELEARTAELSVREARFALDQRRITAPIGGWVGILNVEPGDRVTPDTQLARIDDRSRILVEFRVPERFIARIETGDSVTATPVSRRETPLEGEVRAIDNRVDPATRTITVQAVFDNTGDRLRGGMAFGVNLDFPGESYPTVDPLAIQWGADGAYVWRAAAGTAERIPVRIMQRNADSVLVDGDVALGDRVVTEGVQTLDPGAEIEVAAGATAEAEQAATPDAASET